MRMIAGVLVELSAEERAMMRAIRRMTRMPRDVFAYSAGCTVRSLMSWERGERKPTLAAYTRWYWLIEDLARATRTLLKDPRLPQPVPHGAD
jgi:hypothetical protein